MSQIKKILISIEIFLQKRPAKIFYSIFAILFAIGILGFLLYREKDALLNYPWQFHPGALCISFFLFCCTLILAVKIWMSIMRSLGSKFNYWQHFRSVSISNIAKRLPGTIWYVVWRGEIYKQDGISGKTTALASGVEAIVSIFGGAFASILFGLPILGNHPTGIIALSVMSVICLIFLHPKIFEKILRLLGSDIRFFSYRSILGWICGYFFIWLFGGGILYTVTNIVYPLGLEYLGYIIGCWSMVGISSFLIYFLPTNMGFTEIGISLLLSTIIPSSLAVIVAVLSRALILLYEIIIAVICWVSEIRR